MHQSYKTPISLVQRFIHGGAGEAGTVPEPLREALRWRRAFCVRSVTMADRDNAPHTTVIERRGGGAGLLIGLAVLLLVAVIGYFLIQQSRNESRRSDAVAGAAKAVGDAAKKAGDAIDPDK